MQKVNNLLHSNAQYWGLGLRVNHNHSRKIYSAFLLILLLLKLPSNVVVPNLETHTSFIFDLCIPMSSHMYPGNVVCNYHTDAFFS